MIFHNFGLKTTPYFQPFLLGTASIGLLFLSACKEKGDEAQMQMPPPEVTYLTAERETVILTRELPGRIDPIRIAEVRARVPGVLLKREFVEGSEVKEGDILFRIDPEPLQAARDSAEAALARAEATLKQATITSKRLEGLVVRNAVSRQEVDDAEASVAVAEAEIKAAKSALVTAELNLGYATVTAPIDGIIGRAEVTEGTLVGQGNATLMAVIRQLDPIYFDFTQSTGDLLALRKALQKNRESGNESANEVTLILDDGSEYEHKGKLLFSETNVDETTGMVSLRAQFPNPDKILLPGMFARARVVQSVEENVVTVPQRALTRTANGKGSVYLINDEGNAELRTVEPTAQSNGKWLIESGLDGGEKIIMEGSLRVRPGTPVQAEPFVENSVKTATVEESQ